MTKLFFGYVPGMQGLMTFGSVQEAVRYGFAVCGRTTAGVLVRKLSSSGLWAMALVPTPNGQA